MSNFDYIVVGGGIIGMTTARELAYQGASVALFDKGKLGKEASWAAGGILSAMRPWAEHPASAELSEQGKAFYPGYITSLIKETGIDPEYVRSGLIIVNEAHVTKLNEWARCKCIKVVEEFQNSPVHINLPKNSILLPEISQIRTSRLLKALHKSLVQLKVSIFENTEITELVTKSNQFKHVEFNGDKKAASAVVVTAGAWSQILLAKIDCEINVKPIRGQMLCVKTSNQILDKIILDGSHYLIPRRDGHILIGSTMEEVGFINETTMYARQELIDWAISLMPCLKNVSIVKQWAGLRPSNIQGKPVIARIPNFKNIYLNTGHFRKGILQAPASAKLLADALSGNSSFMDIDRFSIENQTNSAEFA
jgi:glycine oxidase